MNKYIKFALAMSGIALVGAIAYQTTITALVVHKITKGVER